MPERASFEALLEFANKVRAAGGGNPLDALMPAVPEDPSACLIAKNLNFNCHVNAFQGTWYMYVEDEATAHRIADKLGLDYSNNTGDDFEYTDPETSEKEWKVINHAVKLPPEIAQVAADFDGARRVLVDIGDGLYVDDGGLELLRAMAPYIDAATAEALNLASIISPDGSIIL